jgi:hypothetical protein
MLTLPTTVEEEAVSDDDDIEEIDSGQVLSEAYIQYLHDVASGIVEPDLEDPDFDEPNENVLVGGRTKINASLWDGVNSQPQWIKFFLESTGLTNDVITHILSKSKDRLSQRNESRDAFIGEISRGRKPASLLLTPKQLKKQQENLTTYQRMCKEPISKSELLDYLAICIFAGGV